MLTYPVFEVNKLRCNYDIIIVVCHSQLRIGILYCRLLLYGTLELQHHHRQTINVDYAIGDTLL